MPLPREFPPVVYLPCPERVDDQALASVQMRRARDVAAADDVAASNRTYLAVDDGGHLDPSVSRPVGGS